VISRLKRLLRRLAANLRGGSLDRSDHLAEPGWRDHVENPDAWAQQSYDFPPTYVPPTDEGRPRH
jgi:hypothetical protein